MIVIKNGYVINPKSGFEGKADVFIKDDKIRIMDNRNN